jgi:hypothetical protein
METSNSEKQLKTWEEPKIIIMDLENTKGGLLPSAEEFSGSIS